MAELVGRHYVLQETAQSRSGGQSTVRRGIDMRDMSPVAVKFIGGRDDRLQRKIFDREVSTLGSLTHANIVPYRDSGIDDTGSYYIVLDWVDRNLADILKDGPWPSWGQLYRDFAKPFLSGIAHAHLQRVEHRDIKPANILISATGVPLLADFGIAKIRGDQQHSELTVVGFRSGPYAPPEFDSKIPYVRDVYSAGVVLLQCLSTEKILDFPDVAKALENVTVPPEVRRILERCVSTDATERPANATVLSSELFRIGRNLGAAKRQADQYVVIGLTNKAVEALAGDTSERTKAGALLQGDLSGEVFATFRFDHENDEHDRETLLLVGNDYRYTLKVNEKRNGFVCVGVAQPDYEQLEALRRRAAALLPVFTWSTSEPVNRELAQRGFDRLLEAMESHVESRETPAGANLHEGDALFDMWLRSLDAREELARGALGTLRYKHWERQAHQVRFDLASTVEIDLIGTEWQVKDPHTERTFGWGEVVDQAGSSINVLGNRLTSLPESATLVPHIGPSEVALARQREAVTAVRTGISARPDLRDILADPSVNREPGVTTLTPVIHEGP